MIAHIVPAHLRGPRPGDDEAEAGRLRMVERRNRRALEEFNRNTPRRRASEVTSN